MSKFVLLGGAGVFAVHTAKYLLEQSDAELVISVGRNIERGAHYTLDVGKGDSRYQYHQIHMVYEQDRLFELFKKEKPDFVINFAALAYATSWDKSHRYYETNLVALAKICEYLSSKNYLKKFVQIGTSELYGSVDHPVDERGELRPTSPYAVSKLAADMHLNTLWTAQKFPMNIIRPSNAYGPGQQVWRIIPRAILCGLLEQKLPLHGGGVVEKSYLHAADLARAIYLIATNGSPGKIYNAGPEKPVKIRKLVEIISAELNCTVDQLCKITPARKSEDQKYWLDSTLIKRELGWYPEIELQVGIKEMVEWGRQYIDEIRNEQTEFVLRA